MNTNQTVLIQAYNQLRISINIAKEEIEYMGRNRWLETRALYVCIYMRIAVCFVCFATLKDLGLIKIVYH